MDVARHPGHRTQPVRAVIVAYCRRISYKPRSASRPVNVSEQALPPKQAPKKFRLSDDPSNMNNLEARLQATSQKKKVLFFANTDWYLQHFRLPLAEYLRDKGYEVIMVSPYGPYHEGIQAAGFRSIAVPMERRSLNPWRELKLINHLRCLYAEEKPDIAHHFTIKCVVYGTIASELSGIITRVNAVTGLGHIFISPKIKDLLLKRPVSLLLRHAFNARNSRLILQNPDDANDFINAHLVNKKNIRLIKGSGVNTEHYKPTQKNRKESTVRILLASRLLWEKGIREYANTAQELREEGLNAEFMLAGEPDPGNPTSIPAEQLDAWRKEGHVKLLGHVHDMRTLLADIDIAVLPSNREGTPRSLLEAAACGLPLVTTDVPGCREVVNHEVNGLFVSGRTGGGKRSPSFARNDGYPTLSQALRRLCLEPETRARMGAASRAKVLAEFDESIVFEKTLAVYRELENAANTTPDKGLSVNHLVKEQLL